MPRVLPAAGRLVSVVEVAMAVPPGSRLARDQREALAAVAAEPELSAYRSDRRANLLAWMRIHIRHGSWLRSEEDRQGPRATSWPTRAKTCELGRFKATTYKSCRQWWTERGYITVVRPGRTAEARRKSRRTDVPVYDENDACVYAICIPEKRAIAADVAAAHELSRPPQGSPSYEVTPHARDASPVENPDSQGQARTALRAGSLARSAFPRALADHAVLKKLSEKAIRAMWRPFRDRGWTAPDWLWAINHRPDGSQHRKDLAGVRRPAGWLRWRLHLWCDEHGAPILSRSQRAAVHRLALRTQQAADRAAYGLGRRLRYPPDLRPQAG